MRRSKSFRSFAVGFMLLLLAVLTPMAGIAGTPPAVPDIQPPATPPPEIRDVGHSYTYVESQTLRGLIWQDRESSLLPVSPTSPSAIEGLPRELDWTPVRRVAVHPTYSNILYAAIDNGYGLYRSETGGKLWRKLFVGSGSGWAIVFADDNTTCLASLDDGVYISTDTGDSWLDVSAGIDYVVAGAAFEPGDVTRIYAATLGAGVYRGTYTPGVGVSWTPINTGLTDEVVFSIAVSPSNTDILYAGGLNKVWYSTNGGDSWASVDDLYSTYSVYNEAIAVDPYDPDLFYVGSQRLAWVLTTGHTLGGFFRSTTGPGDGHLLLENVGMQETFVLDIAQDPVDDNILYAGTWASGFFRSDDYGDTWTAKNAGLTLPFIYAVEAVVDPGDPNNTILYAGTFYDDHGLYISVDRGESWNEVIPGPYPVIFDVTTTYSAYYPVVATSRGVRLWMDYPTAGWYISNGLTRDEPGIVLELAGHPSEPSRLLAATYGGGIWTSENAGASWTEASSGIGGSSVVFDLTFSPNDIDTAYAGSYGVFGGSYSGGTWSWSSVGRLDRWVRALDAEGAGLPDLFAGTNEEGVYRSPDANGSWSAMNSGLGELRIRALEALEGSDALIAGTNGRSAWKYDGVWTRTGPYIWAPGVVQIAIHPTNPWIIYAATDQGVYYSSNYGDTWTARNKGLGGYGDLVISGISIDRNNPSIVYLGTWGYGVFKWDVPNQRWVRLADPLKSSVVNLPAVQKNYSAPDEVVILYENFEGTFPGVWAVGDDNYLDGYYYWGKRNCRSFEGSYSGWAAGAGDSYLSCYSNYRDNMESWMIYGPFSLVGASGAELNYQLWLDSQIDYDGVCSMASTNGSNFSGSCLSGYSAGWIDQTFDLSSYVGQSSVWIAFVFVSSASTNYPEGGYVDNIELRKWTSSSDIAREDVPAALPDTLHEMPATFVRP